jgi:hypothetical protein
MICFPSFFFWADAVFGCLETLVSFFSQTKKNSHPKTKFVRKQRGGDINNIYVLSLFKKTQDG